MVLGGVEKVMTPMKTTPENVNRERVTKVLSGWPMLPLNILLLIAGPATFITSIALGIQRQGPPLWPLFVAGLLVLAGAIIMLFGFFGLQPNQARVLVLFGEYRGTVRASGFHWGNPFYSNGQSTIQRLAEAAAAAEKGGLAKAATKKTWSRNRISLRARNLNGEKLKVNDKRGNPIEIAAVLVWRVEDTAQAMFDVDDYENYVSVQSESALRHLASCYAYDHGEDNEVTLRSGVDEVSQALKHELQERQCERDSDGKPGGSDRNADLESESIHIRSECDIQGEGG